MESIPVIKVGNTESNPFDCGLRNKKSKPQSEIQWMKEFNYEAWRSMTRLISSCAKGLLIKAATSPDWMASSMVMSSR